MRDVDEFLARWATNAVPWAVHFVRACVLVGFKHLVGPVLKDGVASAAGHDVGRDGGVASYDWHEVRAFWAITFWNHSL